MGDARTKLDILYQDILGDVGDLLTRVERLNERFPELADEVNNSASRLESASTLIQQRLDEYAKKEAGKAAALERQALIDERTRQEAELQKAVNAHISAISNAARNAVTPAADKLLSVALDAIREREVLAKEKAEHPALLERLARPLLYVAFGAIVATVTTWALVSVTPVPGQAISQQR